MAKHLLVSQRTLFLLVIALLFSGCYQKEVSNSVKLQGKLINWGNASKILNSNGLSADFGLGNDQLIKTDSEGNFELSFELEEPTYFSLGRNKLYFSPGDQLYLEVDYKDPEAAVFKGQSAELQTYLSGVAFPKSGSYLSGGSKLKSPDIQQVLKLANEETSKRRELLEGIKSLPDDFIELEITRLKLDQLNTILSLPIYGSFKGYWEYSEQKKAELLVEVKDQLNQLSSGLMSDMNMKHPNFRDMLLDLVDPQLHQVGIFSELKLTPFMAEYDDMGAFVTQLELNGLTSNMLAQADQFLNEEHSVEYKAMVRKKMQEYEALLPGEPAFDILLKDALGNEINLEEFSGKLMYVDLWATWCGPCLEELPAFEKLKEDYAEQEIAFVPISIDTDLEAWQRYLEKHGLPKDKEYVINRLDLADYKVITIPRYFLIDSNFRIIDVFAPVPSDSAIRKFIDEYLEKTE